MFVGHFAVAFLAKRVEPRISLGTLILAAMLPDLMGDVLMSAGIEHIEIGTGIGAANYVHAIQIAYSHSLATGVLWGAIFAGLYFRWRRYRRGAAIIFALVLSHWLLDFISHRPDMPLAPGLKLLFGLGLWSSIPQLLLSKVDSGSSRSWFIFVGGQEIDWLPTFSGPASRFSHSSGTTTSPDRRHPTCKPWKSEERLSSRCSSPGAIG